MQNKRKTFNIVQLILWIITISVLILIIAIPKAYNSLDWLFYIFIGLYFIMPIVLVITKLGFGYYIKKKEKEIHDYIPFIGLILFVPLTIFQFLSSINYEGQKIIIIIGLFILLYNLLSIIIINAKAYSNKLYTMLLFIGISIHIANFLISVQVSFNYSIIW
jgi:hypothetical protein